MTKLEPGQRVRITLEGVVGNLVESDFVTFKFCGSAGPCTALERQVFDKATIEILPEPLKVGDRVRWGTNLHVVFEVLALHGNQVWCRDGNGGCATYDLENLTPIKD